MALIHIRGPGSIFPELGELVPPDHHDAKDLSGGEHEISAYVDEAVIPQIEALGLTVDVIMSDAQLAAYLAEFDEGAPPVG